MSLDLASVDDGAQLTEILFDLKGTDDKGLLLQIQPTHTYPQEEKKFVHGSFNENNLLAVADTNGNVYVIDLEIQKFWKLLNKGITSVISFCNLSSSKLLVALKKGVIYIIDIESGSAAGVLTGHSSPVKEVTYSEDGKYCLTFNTTEAIIWDLFTFSQAHRLTLKNGMFLKKALFMPVHNNIFGCFHNDVMHIWKFETFDCIKQIIPEGWETNVKSVAFTKNGCDMVIGGYNPNIVVFCLNTWAVKKIIELPIKIHGVEYMNFIPQPFDGGSNKILGIITNTSEIWFLDIESSLFLSHTSCLDKLVENFSVSPTGRYLAIMMSGEVNIYLVEKILIRNNSAQLKTNYTASKKLRQKCMEELAIVHNKIKEELSLRKLIPILKQFGEYPESYRGIIWKTILQIPMNQKAFQSLASKKCHPSFLNLESKYPLVNKALCNGLKWVLSSLAHWCSLFGEVLFLPEFVFPFVKLLHFDSHVCFEAIATIIVNWCQNWFEFYPFPPINILSMIENVLGYHDPDLLEFYFKKNVGSCLYACILMQTAFSEVLNRNEWLRLWDHILSNEPSFIFMIVVAYNVICRNSVKNFENYDDFEAFFHRQNAIDIKLLISKSYYFLNHTPSDIHPRRYLTAFSPLKRGDTYTSFEAYPKIILDRNTKKLHLIKKEEQEILREQRKAIAMKKELEKKFKSDQRNDFREEVLTELEEKYRQVISSEEKRISAQRRKLQNLRSELRLKELAVLEEVRDQILKKRKQKKELEINQLLRDITYRREREKVEVEAAEEELRNYYSSLLLRKYRLKIDAMEKNDSPENGMAGSLSLKQDKLKCELSQLQNEIAGTHHDKKIETANKIAKFSDMLQNIELKMTEELIKKESNLMSRKNKKVLENLWKSTKTLGKKLEELLGDSLMLNSSNADENGSQSIHIEQCVRPSLKMPTETDPDELKEKWPDGFNNGSSDSEHLENDKELWKKGVEESFNFSEEIQDNNDQLDKILQDKEVHEEVLGKEMWEIKGKKKVQLPFDKSHKCKTKFTDCYPDRSCSSHTTEFSESVEFHSESSLDHGSRRGGNECNKYKFLKPINNSTVDIESKKQKSRSLPLIASNILQSDSLSCTSDNESSVMKMALFERQKLIREAKQSISFDS